MPRIKKTQDLKIYINSTDLNYKIIVKGKEIEKTEKVIIITTDKMRENHTNKNINNIFIDNTYKIFPKKNHIN